MEIIGNLIKMSTNINEGLVEYTLILSDEKVKMNTLIEKELEISWLDEINCIECGNKTIKSFAQGYCYPCFASVPQTAPCILRPELCEAHLGISRDSEWSKKNCLSKHIVYLALSSGLKVGVTRATQIPTRWIDQGAVKAIKFAETPNRYLAGLLEIDLKKHISDRTSWQKMLKNQVNYTIDLVAEKEKAINLLRSDLTNYIVKDNSILKIKYPVNIYPEKIKSINLEKDKQYKGNLAGIKGQYLIFEDGCVINIRKYNGYKISLCF
ncbi:MAG: DUF2797 domain-containing protein [Bacteroidales bacterium]|nr:DUF2797 domain-containing protein [Bacteroidales bacterium]